MTNVATLLGAASIEPFVHGAGHRGADHLGAGLLGAGQLGDDPLSLAGGLLVLGGGAITGVLLRRLVRSGRHRLPEDRPVDETPRPGHACGVGGAGGTSGAGGTGGTVRDPRWLPSGLALGWLGVVAGLGDQPAGVVVAYLAALTVGAWLMAVDVDVHRLPNVVTLPAIPVSALALAGCSALARDPPASGRALLGGLVLGAGYLLLFVVGVRRGTAGIGLGDVKLAVSLGQWLAWLGWSALLIGAYVGLVLSGLCALGLLAARRAGPHTALPHGPAMVAGAWLGLCAAPFL